MLNSQHGKENRCQNNKCFAPNKRVDNAENYARNIARAPLGGLQQCAGGAAANQYLCVPEKSIKLQRSKSTSESDRNAATTTRFGNRFSPAVFQNQHSETQKCATKPALNQPMRCLPARTISMRSKSVSQYADENHIKSSTPLPQQNAGPRAPCGCKVPETNRKAVLQENAKQLYKTLEIGKYVQEMTLQQESSSNYKNKLTQPQPTTIIDSTASRGYSRRSRIQVLSGNLAPECQPTSYYGTQKISVQSSCASDCNYTRSISSDSTTTAHQLAPARTTLSIGGQSITQRSHLPAAGYSNQTRFTNSTVTSADYANNSGSTISTTVAYNIDEVFENSNGNVARNSVSSRVDEVTQSRRISHLRTPLLLDDSRSFVDGNEFFEEEQEIATRTESISPLVFDLPIPKNVSSQAFPGCMRRPNAKTTLRSRSSLGYQNKELFYVLEYATDIIQYLRTIEQDLLVHPTTVDQLVNKTYRTAYVNKLMQLTHVRIPNNDPVFFMALRIFDWTIVNMKLRDKVYRLAAMISFWIATKYLTNAEIKATKIYSICSGHFTKIQILSMEATIIKKLQFNLAMADPLDFLNYYMKALNLENDKHLENSAHFITDCSTLHESYMTTRPSFLAAAAISLAYRLLCQTEELFSKFEWHRTEQLQNYANTVLVHNARRSISMKYEPFVKYCTTEQSNVVQYFEKMLLHGEFGQR